VTIQKLDKMAVKTDSKALEALRYCDFVKSSPTAANPPITNPKEDQTRTTQTPVAGLNTTQKVDQPGTALKSTSDGSALSPSNSTKGETNLAEIRADAVRKLGTGGVHTVLITDPAAKTTTGSVSRWPLESQRYAIYRRKNLLGQEITGITTVGLSNPYSSSFFFPVGKPRHFLPCVTLHFRLG
jgi:hypothetical protein